MQTMLIHYCTIFLDRKSTRLNSSHQIISYAVFCLKKKNTRLNSSHQIISYAVFCLKKKKKEQKNTKRILQTSNNTPRARKSHARYKSRCMTHLTCAHVLSMSVMRLLDCARSYKDVAFDRIACIAERSSILISFFFFNDTATTEIFTLSLHDALLFFLKEPAPPEISPLPLLGPLPI